MKRKLKSPYKSPKGIIVLAVVLANLAIVAPQKVEGQKQIDISDPTNGNNRCWVDFTVWGVNFYGCVNGGSDCLDDIVITP